MAIHNLTQKTKASTGMIFGSKETNSEAKLKFLENKINDQEKKLNKIIELLQNGNNISNINK
jgi:hypothetical protein